LAEPDSVDSYEYLLRIRIDRVKASAIEDAEKAVVKAEDLLKALENTGASKMWMRDLDEFMDSWGSMKEERLALLVGDGSVKKKTTKKR